MLLVLTLLYIWTIDHADLILSGNGHFGSNLSVDETLTSIELRSE